MAPDRARRDALAWLARFRIPEYAERRAEELSKGNQQKVQFIAAVLHDPEVLLMDEPFTGLDPVNLILLREAFAELRDRGRTRHLLDPPDGDGRGDVRIGRDRRPRAARGRRPRPRPQARERAADAPARGRRRPVARLAGRAARCRWTRPDAERSSSSSCCPARIPRRSSRRSLATVRSVTRFEVVEPSLEAIFIEHVGRPSDDDPTLAPDAPAAALSPRRCRLMADRDPLLPNAGIVARREYRDRTRSPLFLASTVVLALLAMIVALAPIAIRERRPARP